MNQSLPTVFNLTPAASYSCYTWQGQLSWNATTRTLTVVGTVFFDGSITMTTTGNQPMIYTGTGSGGACTQTADCQAVIYASGDISINSEKLCAKLNWQRQRLRLEQERLGPEQEAPHLRLERDRPASRSGRRRPRSRAACTPPTPSPPVRAP